jgi:hypothetical protein
LNGLEEQFQKLGSDSLQFYESFLNRVYELSKQSTISTEQHKTFNYLITAVLSKISFIKSNSHSDLIIDIGTFLFSVKQDIVSLKELEKDQVKKEIIEKHKLEFKVKIDRQIEEAESFIKTEVVPAINDNKVMIDNQIELLLQETIAMQGQAKDETEKLEEVKRKMENVLELNAICNSFKFIGQALNFMGPYGATAGGVIGMGASIGGSFIQNPDGNSLTMQLPKGVQTTCQVAIVDMRIAFDQKSNNFLKLIEDNSKEISDVGSLSDIKLKIDVFKQQKIQYKDNPEKLKEIEENLKTELKTELNLKTEPTTKEH